MAQVSVRQARDNLSQLIKDAQAGEDVVIASHGAPVARIVPVTSGHTGADIVGWLDANRLPPGSQRSRSDIDTQIEAERDSWE